MEDYSKLYRLSLAQALDGITDPKKIKSRAAKHKKSVRVAAADSVDDMPAFNRKKYPQYFPLYDIQLVTSKRPKKLKQRGSKVTVLPGCEWKIVRVVAVIPGKKFAYQLTAQGYTVTLGQSKIQPLTKAGR